MRPAAVIDAGRHPLADGRPPDWASGWGQDRYGLYVAFTIEDVEQRLRWIPPGRFVMGSPEDEQGRWGDEGPQHEVTLSKGFWLADTPCTQALWSAVMGNNPSRFLDPQRPVERVSWEEAQEFLARLDERVPDLDPTLPSEAQWEYACRAGTATATYAGPMPILGENNAPVLDDIAWYGGNSEVGYDLEEGDDSSGWKEKQHPHRKAGTRRVATKRPNGWGLYDMLGNVYEWCADAWHDSYEGAPADGSTWEGGEGRVIRGGSWCVRARLCRAAYRSGNAPDYRLVDLGFRFARVQV